MSADCCGGAPAPDPGAIAEPGESLRFWHVRELQASLFAAVLLAVGLIAHRSSAYLPEVASVGALLVGGWIFVPDAVRGLRRGRVGVGLLMTVAAVGAVLLGQLFEAAMLAVLFSGSEGLEAYSLARTRSGLRSLLSLAPDTASIIRDGAEVTVATAELVVGDTMIVRPGQRVATDGVVTKGLSAIDVSALTGESVPIEVTVGDKVPAAAINGGGALEVVATAAAHDNSLARIVHIVETEQARKGASQRMADRVARPLVPAIVVLAIGIAALGSLLGDSSMWISRALVVLVAASPCALAISVPVTSVAAIGAASRLGVLIKGGAALEELGRISAVAFDKTGTLTRNRPEVIETIAAGSAAIDEVLAVAASKREASIHSPGRSWPRPPRRSQSRRWPRFRARESLVASARSRCGSVDQVGYRQVHWPSRSNDCNTWVRLSCSSSVTANCLV